jgi:hypothetical protein
MSNSTLTKKDFNTAIVSLRYLLQCVKSNESEEEQAQLLRIIASAANTFALKIEGQQ